MEFVSAATEMFGDEAVLNRQQVQQVVDTKNISYPFWFVAHTEYKPIGTKGQYRLPPLDGPSQIVFQGSTDGEENTASQLTPGPFPVSPPSPSVAVPAPSQIQYVRMARLVDESQPEIPTSFPGYVPFGFYNDMKSLLASNIFFPIMVTGLSGNGKTLMIRQAAAATKRKLIRINVSIETDQADLLGGPVLVDGNIVNRDGPVLLAMQHGAVLLLDEIDRGSNKLLCLQSILEGEPYFNKNTGQVVHPKKGFQICATANTKGKGSEDGRYLAQILDDAFLERYPITVMQDYPPEKTELIILDNKLKEQGRPDEDFSKKLVMWAQIIRKAYNEGSVSELISTRRLVNICQAYSIYGSRNKAIEYCVARFDEESRNAMMEFYSKIDASVNPKPNVGAIEKSAANIWDDEINGESP